MGGYEIALFVHVVGAVIMFGGVALFQVTGMRLRGAETVEEVGQWLAFTRSGALLFPVGSVTLLLSGLALTASAWTFTTPWVALGLAALVVLGAVGSQVQRRRFMAIGRAAAAAGPGPLPRAVADPLVAPATWVPLFASNGLAVGVLWLMTIKPGWLGSVVALLGFAVAGAVLGGLATASRRSRAAVTSG